MTPDQALADVRAEREYRDPDNPVERAHAFVLAREVEQLRAELASEALTLGSWQSETFALRAELAARAEALDRVQALHSEPPGGDRCFECDNAWPCRTFQTLNGEERDRD